MATLDYLIQLCEEQALIQETHSIRSQAHAGPPNVETPRKNQKPPSSHLTSTKTGSGGSGGDKITPKLKATKNGGKDKRNSSNKRQEGSSRYSRVTVTRGRSLAPSTTP